MDDRQPGVVEVDTSPSTSGPASKAKQALGPEELLQHALTLYRLYNPAQLTLDSHADNALAELGISNPSDNVFIRQVLYGVVRYRQFLGSLMDSFYYYNR